MKHKNILQAYKRLLLEQTIGKVFYVPLVIRKKGKKGKKNKVEAGDVGDFPGHPFRGNQYTSGEGGSDNSDEDTSSGSGLFSSGDVRLFHGTYGSVLKNILTDGLIPQEKKTYDTTQDYYTGKRGKSIFLAEKERDAKEYGMEVAFNKKDAVVVVLKVIVPKEQRGTLKRDELHGGIQGTNASFYKPGNIPKDWIKGYTIYSATNGSEIEKKSLS